MLRTSAPLIGALERIGNSEAMESHKSMDPPPEQLDNANVRQPELLTRLVGGILFLCGFLPSLLVSNIVRGIWVGKVQFGIPETLALGICTPLALFCFAAGYRLVANLPNKYGSILSPAIWNIFCAVFLATCGLLLYAESIKHSGIAPAYLMFPASLAYTSYRCGKAAKRRAEAA